MLTNVEAVVNEFHSKLSQSCRRCRCNAKKFRKISHDARNIFIKMVIVGIFSMEYYVSHCVHEPFL